MKNIRAILYYSIAAGIFFTLKFGYTQAENDDLTFLLKPTDKFVGFLTGSNSVYEIDKGYFHNQLNIYIDKSCSGFNFWILSFLMLAFLGLKNLDSEIKKVLTIPLALVAGYLLTIFVNTSRIFASIIIQNQKINIFEIQPHIIHEAIGIITNLSFLILAYYITNRILIKKIHHEKLT